MNLTIRSRAEHVTAMPSSLTSKGASEEIVPSKRPSDSTNRYETFVALPTSFLSVTVKFPARTMVISQASVMKTWTIPVGLSWRTTVPFSPVILASEPIVVMPSGTNPSIDRLCRSTFSPSDVFRPKSDSSPDVSLRSKKMRLPWPCPLAYATLPPAFLTPIPSESAASAGMESAPTDTNRMPISM